MPATPYQENPTAVARILTEEEKHKIAKDRELADLKLAEEGKAKFKIELMFTQEFSIIKPVPGIISFWESGAQFHGGGDSIIHWCPGRVLKRNDCEHYIPDPSHGFGILMCPKCQTVWKGEQVIGQYIARLTAQGWAQVLCDYYRRLDMNCDVVIKYHKNDIRSASRQRHSADSLHLVRSAQKRLKRIYTLANIMRDTSAGSSLYDRMIAFVKA